METFNIYSDESCHLPNDKNKVFVIGSILVKQDKVKQITTELKEIKKKHNLSKTFESKWTKVSKSKYEYYSDLVDYFFISDHLNFRAIIVQNKSALNHSHFNQDHNTWYYKMFYLLIKFFLKSNNYYNLYFDIKDTKSNYKVKELRRILNITSVELNFLIKNSQNIRSNESEIMQITDLLIGAISYSNRELLINKGKVDLIDLIKNKAGLRTLNFSTTMSEVKFNLFVWKPRT